MKKILVALLALAVIGFAFAQDAKPAYELSLDSTVTWGYDFYTGSTGFTNESNFELLFPIAANATGGMATSEGLHGEISVNGMNLAVKSDGDVASLIDNDDEDGYYDTITAKIVDGPLYFTFASKPSFKLNNARAIDPLSLSDDYDASLTSLVIANSSSRTGGFELGYKTTMYSAALKVASHGDWTQTAAGDDTVVQTVYIGTGTETAVAGTQYFAANDPTLTTPLAVPLTLGTMYRKVVTTAGDAAIGMNEKNLYTLGATYSFTPLAGVLTLSGASFKDMYGSAKVASYWGTTGKVAFTPMAAVAFNAAADFMGTRGEANVDWDASTSASYTMENADSANLSAYYAPDFTVGGVNPYAEVAFKVTEDADKGFVPALGAAAYVRAYDLLNNQDDHSSNGQPFIVGGSAEYTVTIAEGQTVKPYGTVDYNMFAFKDAIPLSAGTGMAFTLGVEAAVITNVTITAEWAGGEVADDGDKIYPSAISPVGKKDSDAPKGVFTLACKIEL